MKNRIIAENIRVPVSADDREILAVAENRMKKAGVCYEKDTLCIHKRSVDARHKGSLTFVCSVMCEGTIPEGKGGADGIRSKEIPELSVTPGGEKTKERPVIVGFGPAGMFCGMLLAKYGYKPLIFERGQDISGRVAAVERFYRGEGLDESSNIQFGAGGAGTFSDGKLTTRIGDERCEFVLTKMHELGAPEDILRRAKPHIGTDVLRGVVENAEREIRALGGEIRYNSKVDEIGDGYVVSGGEKIPCSCTVIAVGHSARDTYSFLTGNGFAVEAKPFSVGVRAEHLQSELDGALYGDAALAERLGHAEYQLSWRRGERGVYTFCMCPGGEVVAAASEAGGVVTNGMSRHARDGRNGNAAIAVSVLPEDFGGDPMKAVEFQRKLEKAAFAAGGSNYAAPCQSLGSFLGDKSSRLGTRISPTYMNGNVRETDIAALLPANVSEMLKCGLRVFGTKISGYSAPDVPLTGIETRTSAPLRIQRDEALACPGHPDVYPCGEGAGYAGGIMSAAVDGIRVASAVISRFALPD